MKTRCRMCGRYCDEYFSYGPLFMSIGIRYRGNEDYVETKTTKEARYCRLKCVLKLAGNLIKNTVGEPLTKKEKLKLRKNA